MRRTKIRRILHPEPVRSNVRPPRSGITLIEVLVSLFVLTIGILGVIAALPIGSYSLNKAKIADRAGACAQAALADTRIRGLADVDRLYSDIDPTVNLNQAYAIDPLVYAHSGGATAAETFPFNFNAPVGLPRMTLSNSRNGSAAMPTSVADRLFIWGDQLKHSVASEEDALRPSMIFVDATGKRLPFENCDKRVCMDTEGEFSWMLTVSPRTKERIAYGGVGQSWIEYDVTHREITAVVFQNRIKDVANAIPTTEAPATEREVACTLLGGGYGGGEVVLSGEGIDLLLDETDYIMLHGPRQSQVQSGTGSLIDPGEGTVCQWYRVLSYSEPEAAASGGPMQVYVTLSGPDWRYNLDSTSGEPAPCKAVICDGVRAAFTTTISVDDTWPWGP